MTLTKSVSLNFCRRDQLMIRAKSQPRSFAKIALIKHVRNCVKFNSLVVDAIDVYSICRLLTINGIPGKCVQSYKKSFCLSAPPRLAKVSRKKAGNITKIRQKISIIGNIIKIRQQISIITNIKKIRQQILIIAYIMISTVAL